MGTEPGGDTLLKSGPMSAAQPAVHNARPALLPPRQGVGLTLLIVAWAILVGITCWAMFAYEFEREPGGSGNAVAHWPADAQIARTPGRPTLLLFLHPKCPCSRASLAELERIWVLQNDQNIHTPQLVVVATVPPDESDDWLATDTVEQALRLPGAQLVADPGGREAQRFGATTSGTVMWFDPEGKCLYAGGITSGRGHEGSNVGRDCLEQLMRGELPSQKGMPALGCRLCLPDAQ